LNDSPRKPVSARRYRQGASQKRLVFKLLAGVYQA